MVRFRASPRSGEHRGDARNLGDPAGVLQALQHFDHENEYDVVVDPVSVSSRYAHPHAGVEGVYAIVTPRLSPATIQWDLFDCDCGP